jgi:transcriptional regulator with XRE-family HTH domain
LRERAEISQEELAFRAGLDRTYVSGIERGRRNPSLKSMQRIAAQLEMSLDEVLGVARQLAEAGINIPADRLRACCDRANAYCKGATLGITQSLLILETA